MPTVIGRQQGRSGDGHPVAHVQLLGAVRVVRPTGERVELPSPSQRRLVALLAIHAGVSLRGGQLCELLGIQSGALRATVSRVRRLIGEDVLHTDAVGYRIEASSDLSTFADAVAGALAAGRIDAYDEALQIWQGPPLDEFAAEAWAEATVARFDELRLVAVEGRASELVRAGRLGEAAAELMMHVADHPLRDRAQGLLMLALAAQGRQAEALRSFEAYRRHLADHVGTVPSPEVRELDRWIADGTTTLGPGWPTPGHPPSGGDAPDPTGSSLHTTSDGSLDATSPPASSMRSAGIPVFRSSFVGRDRELAGVLAAVRSGRSVTLVGEGGVGKTRLSACVAEHLVVDGPLWFVELAPVSDAGDLVGSVAAQLGASLVAGQSGVEAFINDRAAVLVVDNCEHLVDTVAEFVDTLLGACPALVVLATSREPLGIAGERVYRVPPLDPSSDAADLFVSRAEAAGAVVRPDQRDEVESVCRRLDGNPLAIELAAPRAAALGLRTIIDGLDDRFVLLSGGRRRGDERHQTLRAVVEWSDRLLNPLERATFRTLGVFSGGFELDAAQHVLHSVGMGGEPVLTTLAALVQRSMVVAESGELGTRFRLLDTLRAYAVEQLHDAGEFESISAAHAAWVASITDDPLERWMTRDGHHRSLRLEREVDNWRDAMAYAASAADPALVQRLCGAPMGLFLWGRPDLVDHAETLDTQLADRSARSAAEGVEADPSDRAARAAVAYGRWGSAWLGLDLTALTDACDRFDRLVPDDVTGIAATMRAATLLVGGDMAAATAVRTGSLDDPRLVPGGRDLMAAITVYGACSAGLRDRLADEWTRSVGELAQSSDVAAIRKLARVAISWLLVDADPARSVTALHEALADPEPIPAYWDRIIETFASRFLMQVSPDRAAQHLLEVLPGFGAGLAAADAVALVTSAGLLAVSGHPATDDIVATLAATTSADYLATVVRDVTERSATGRMLGSDQIVPVVRAALEDIARGTGSPADAQV